jgi:hypothetical protein
LLFKTNRFSRLFPTIGSQIITEPRSLEDYPCLERTSCPTDGATVAIPEIIASQFLQHVQLEFLTTLRMDILTLVSSPKLSIAPSGRLRLAPAGIIHLD